MNKTLIATAVSAALLAPVAAQADVTVYGRIHQGIEIVDTDGGESTTNFITVGSRFGIKASSDLGNGLSAHARYEFATRTDENRIIRTVDVVETGEPTTDPELRVRAGGGVTGLRLAYVGISGGFGSIDFGQQWGAFYNTAGVHFDPTFWVGTTSYGSVGNQFRVSNTVKYSNGFGPVHLEVDKRIGDDHDGGSEQDGYTIGISVAAHENVTFAAAIDDEDDDTSTALAVKVSGGKYWGSVGWYGKDIDDDNNDGPSSVQFLVGGDFGNTSVFFGIGEADLGGTEAAAGNNPSDVYLGVYHGVGGGLNLLYEGRSVDTDGAGNDSTTHLFGIRLDF